MLYRNRGVAITKETLKSVQFNSPLTFWNNQCQHGNTRWKQMTRLELAINWKVFISPYTVYMKILSFMTAGTNFK